MSIEFDDFKAMAQGLCGDDFIAGERNCFSVATDLGPIEFFHTAGVPTMVQVRAKIIDLDEIQRPGDFAMAALAANFFWSGTNGATLSVSEDNALYATERRLVAELAEAEDFKTCLADFFDTVATWRERSELYA